MALLNSNKFDKIVQRYGFETEVFGYVRKYILRNYYIKDNKQPGRCLIMICNKSGRRFFLQKKYRCFDLRFSFWGIPEDLETGRKSFIHLNYEYAETISFRELKRRAVNQPEDEVLREAKQIINPIGDIHYNMRFH
jgi:hypothetical protein